MQHLGVANHDPQLEGRINSFELAFRMQTEAPDLMDISARKAKPTRDLYGIDEKPTDNFGRQCLLARRFSEKGVRFVQVSHSYKWDQHGEFEKRADHQKNASEVDKPIAGLLKDLKSRGLLDETLVVWGGEFGRTPTAQGGDGRDHNPHGFTMWMAGGGVKPGFVYGATDDYGWFATAGQNAYARPPRHHLAPLRHGSQKTHLPLCRTQLPPHRRLRRRRGEGYCLIDISKARRLF